MSKTKLMRIVMLFVAVVTLALLMAVTGCSSSTSTTSSAAATQTTVSSGATTTSNAVTINIAAQNMAFDQSSITVKAGAQVTMIFNNKDSMPHNVAIYNDQSAAQVIYKGEVFNGPATKTYTFTAPSTPGTYFFRCDVHPVKMTGQFIVQ
jgi:plastocyanin